MSAVEEEALQNSGESDGGAPTTATLLLALDALKKDSVRWKEVADGLGSAKARVAALNIAAGEFPKALLDRGLHGLYDQLRDWQIEQLDGGEMVASSIVDELLMVRSIHTGQDEQISVDLKGLWDIK